MKSHDTSLKVLMQQVASGAAQLPDFQRGWVWDDGRIRALIYSVIRNFPVGAAMFLEYGSPEIQFRYQPIEGAPASAAGEKPSMLILDGQQRLTSLYNAMYAAHPVKTQTEKKQPIERYYYLDIEKALDPSSDADEIVRSIPATKLVTSNFGRTVELDVTTQEKEFEHKLFPLNIILDYVKGQDWQNKYYAYHHFQPEVIAEFTQFSTQFVMRTIEYAMPVITLEKDTPKEAVCQVFENVNTGGVSLTVFELVTAVFAMHNFPLRKDWEERQKRYFSDEILSVLTATDFLTSLTLLASYAGGRTVSCKKKDVLNLTFEDYQTYADALCDGFVLARNFLKEERIFSRKDLPYTTQLIPLGAICTVLAGEHQLMTKVVRDKVRRWYWCGVFGELYGSANETRYANDIVQVVAWVKGGDLPKTVTDAYFNPRRLLGMQSRQSAAYKGIMALILKNKSRDFISGVEMDFTCFSDENVDIHHIFPRAYAESQHYEKAKWNSVVNKTPISAKSNRTIGGDAPSKYLGSLERAGAITPENLDEIVETHWIDHELLRKDDFEAFIVDRAKKLLDAIEQATGMPVSGRDSEDVVQAFGQTLK